MHYLRIMFTVRHYLNILEVFLTNGLLMVLEGKYIKRVFVDREKVI